ncbi:MAG: acyltransferase domain-containing protein [Bacteroidota bacterium]
MDSDKIAFVFPAFISEYKDDPAANVSEFNELFMSYLKKAAEFADRDLLEFTPGDDPTKLDELKNQFISYIYSCTCADLLIKEGVKPGLLAGYSMGIYAALYTASSISFETGLLFIRTAYNAIRKSLSFTKYGMCGVIGLSEKDIKEIASRFDLDLMIVNRNSEVSFVIAGSSFHIHVFALKAKEEGALHIRQLVSTIPYHTNLLSDAAKVLSEVVMTADVQSPRIPVISTLRQDMIADEGRAREEVVNNIHLPFNWYATQLRMFESGIQKFTECGPSQMLLKNSKFIKDGGKFVTWNSLLKVTE